MKHYLRWLAVNNKDEDLSNKNTSYYLYQAQKVVIFVGRKVELRSVPFISFFWRFQMIFSLHVFEKGIKIIKFFIAM